MRDIEWTVEILKDGQNIRLIFGSWENTAEFLHSFFTGLTNHTENQAVYVAVTAKKEEP